MLFPGFDHGHVGEGSIFGSTMVLHENDNVVSVNSCNRSKLGTVAC